MVLTPAAVVFDLGNVLIRWDPHPAIAAAVGDDEAAASSPPPTSTSSAWNSVQDSGRPWDEAEAEAAASHPHWAGHAAAYRTHFAALACSGPIAHSVDVLRDLHAAGVPLVALTNWSGELFPHARERFDFLALFDDIVVSGDEGVAKPAPEIFAAAEAAGRPAAGALRVRRRQARPTWPPPREAGLDAIVFTDTDHLRADLRARGLPV